MYPVIFFDALRVKIRKDVMLRNKALCLAQGCCPTARVLTITNNDALHLDKEEAFSQSPTNHTRV
jgi:hypothetical protein